MARPTRGVLETITRYASLDGTQMVGVSAYGYDEFVRLVRLDHYQDPAEPLAQYTWTYEGGAVGLDSDDDLDAILAALEALPDHVWTLRRPSSTSSPA